MSDKLKEDLGNVSLMEVREIYECLGKVADHYGIIADLGRKIKNIFLENDVSDDSISGKLHFSECVLFRRKEKTLELQFDVIKDMPPLFHIFMMLQWSLIKHFNLNEGEAMTFINGSKEEKDKLIEKYNIPEKYATILQL